MHIFVSTGKFPVSTLVGVFVGTLWCILHRKNLNLRGHFRGHLRVHSRGHFREHFRERVRGSNFAVRVLCAFLTKSKLFQRFGAMVIRQSCRHLDGTHFSLGTCCNPIRSRTFFHARWFRWRSCSLVSTFFSFDWPLFMFRCPAAA